jgi:predicted nucleic-acid-binding Zn-ribbon protein
MVNSQVTDNKELFDKLKHQLMMYDPVRFCEEYLTLDGAPFTLSGNGYRPLSDIYRYVGIKALEPNAKPIIIVKARQIGATTMASALEMYFMGSGLFGGSKPPVRIIHTFPQLELAAAYSKTKLNQIISQSKRTESDSLANKGGKSKSYMQSLLDTSSPTNDSLTFKQFVGGNHLWIESTGIDADRLMGRSADIIFFDEAQKTNSLAIGNALKILTTAKYGRPSKGVQIYFGTPRRKGSDYHKMWQASSQQYYYLGCEKCKEYFPFYTPESEDWKKIWIHGKIVKCPKCGFEQDKLQATDRGKWIAFKNPDDEDCTFIGFHINQLYMPMFTRESIDNEMPGKHPINTERVFMNEVLGEFFQGDSSPITHEEIRELCGDIGRKFSSNISSGTSLGMTEQTVVLGIDYGARSDLEQLANPDKSKAVGQSYSTAVILLSKGPGLLSIEYCMKFKRNDPESKREIIDQLMRRYSVQLTVGDIGYSNDFSYNMHQTYGDKYIVSRAHNKVNDHVKFNIDAFPKEIIFERDFYIGELYEQMKKGMIRFPYGSYDEKGGIAWLIDHCCNMEIKPSISRNGSDPSVHYVKSGANDGFSALLNAYIAYKFLVSRGFTNNNPMLQKTTNKPLVIGGFIDRRL